MKVGCAAVFQNQELLKRLLNKSIYSAEAIAIDLAVNTIANHKSSKFIIYAGSKSVLQVLQSKDSSTPLITWTLFLKIWIPSHIGIQGNEKADKAAQKALQAHISNTKIPYTDLKPRTNKFILKKWQKFWDDQTQNKLHIQDIIGEWPAGYRRNSKRKSDNLQTSYWPHPHYPLTPPKKRRPPPICSTCKVPLTVKHILINCDRFRQIRPKHYQTNDLKDLFKTPN